MLTEFGIETKKIFKVAVVSTMSSGKSTFINALMGKEFLLSRNEACSAQIIYILDNDTNENEKAYIISEDNKIEKYDNVDRDLMEKINTSSNIDKVLIESEIKGIKNTDRAMVIIDTPGVNNSMDVSHKDKTMNLLKQLDKGLIIYMINATQIATDDDYALLKIVAEDVKHSNGNKKVLFVVNKIDELDDEREDIGKCMNNIHKYLTDLGIINPQIYPISALGCKLFRKAMAGENFTRHECLDFEKMYDRFEPKSFNLNSYIISDERLDKEKSVNIRDSSYQYSDLYLAIDNTGMSAVENAIEDIMAEFGDKYNPHIVMDKYEEDTESDKIFSYSGFELKNGLIVSCPVGNAPLNNRVRNGESIARFKRKICRVCKRSKECGIIIQPKSAMKIIKKEEM